MQFHAKVAATSVIFDREAQRVYEPRRKNLIVFEKFLEIDEIFAGTSSIFVDESAEFARITLISPTKSLVFADESGSYAVKYPGSDGIFVDRVSIRQVAEPTPVTPLGEEYGSSRLLQYLLPIFAAIRDIASTHASMGNLDPMARHHRRREQVVGSMTPPDPGFIHASARTLDGFRLRSLPSWDVGTGLPRDPKRGVETLNPWEGRGLRDKKAFSQALEGARMLESIGQLDKAQKAELEAFEHKFNEIASDAKSKKLVGRGRKLVATGLAAYLGYELIIRGFLLDALLGGTGLDIVSTLFGG